MLILDENGFFSRSAGLCARTRLKKTFSPKLVGPSGLEPPTSRLSGVRSNHLSYEPIFTRVRQSFRHQLTGSRFNLLRGSITFVILFSFQLRAFAFCALWFVGSSCSSEPFY